MTIEFDAKFMFIDAAMTKSKFGMFECAGTFPKARYGEEYHVTLTPKVAGFARCPFCWGCSELMVEETDQGYVFRGKCTVCGALGPKATSSTKAGLKWNNEG